MTLVDVRRAARDDWQTVRRLRLAALADAPSAFLTTLEEARAYPDELWQDRIQTSPHLIASIDGEPIGKAVVIAGGSGPELVAVWVAPERRGDGVIEALFDAAVVWGKEQGARQLCLWVVDTNARAERAYERYGFRRTGRSQPVPGRLEETEVEMALRL